MEPDGLGVCVALVVLLADGVGTAVAAVLGVGVPGAGQWAHQWRAGQTSRRCCVDQRLGQAGRGGGRDGMGC